MKYATILESVYGFESQLKCERKKAYRHGIATGVIVGFMIGAIVTTVLSVINITS